MSGTRGVLAGSLVGMAVGVVASATNTMNSPLGQAASVVVNAGWVWAAVAVAAGWLAGARRAAALAGVLALVATTTAYYAADAVLRHEAMASYWPELRVWWLVSVAVGSVLGVVGCGIGRPGVLGLLAELVVPVGAAVEMAWLPRWPPGAGPVPALDLVRPVVWAAAALAAAVAVIRFTGWSGWTGSRGTTDADTRWPSRPRR